MRELRSLFSHLTQLVTIRWIGRLAGEVQRSRRAGTFIPSAEDRGPSGLHWRIRSSRVRQRKLVTGQIDNKRAKLYLGRAARQY